MKYKKGIDYNVYRMTIPELIFEYLKGTAVCAVFALLFYKSIVAFLLLLPYSYFYVKGRKKQKIAERRQKLNQDFIEGIKSLSAALNVGYSVENAFREAYKELSLLYGKKTDIMQEFYSINQKIQMNCTVESALGDFAKRSGVEDIRDFAEVFSTAKRTGGDIIKIIKNTCLVMESRMEMQREIDISIAGKKYESKIMNLIPLGIIGYMWFFSADFMKPMYHNFTGVMIMTGALAVYLFAVWLSNRILVFDGL
jgi:tight adherence protein B